MTNEEARQWFLKVYSEIKGQGYADENEEAYELAIKALEQEPTEIECFSKEFVRAMRKYAEQEPTSVKQDTVPVKLRINKVSKHISNIDLDEFEQEPTDDKCHYCEHNFTPYQGNTGEFTEQEPTDEMVHVETLHQVMWERDIAIEQLKELGYCLGQKIEPCTDSVSRQAVLDLAEKGILVSNGNYKSVCKAINELPSVQPTKFSTRCPECGAWFGYNMRAAQNEPF